MSANEGEYEDDAGDELVRYPVDSPLPKIVAMGLVSYDGDPVEIGRGLRVWPRFEALLLYTATPCSIAIIPAVAIADGAARLIGLRFAVNETSEDGIPLTIAPGDLRDVPWATIVDYAVGIAAAECTRPEPHRLIPPPEEYDDWQETVRRGAVVASTQRRRRTVTPELLARVLDLYASGGVPLLRKELNMSDRNARRLLARARKELGQ